MSSKFPHYFGSEPSSESDLRRQLGENFENAATRKYVDDEVAAAILAAGSGDHGLLAGLGDDDHTQYVRTDATRDFTGTPEVNGVPVVLDSDARLTDARTPTGAAGGVLSGTYPNPGFAADMATQAELDAAQAASEAYADSAVLAHTIDTTDAHDASAISFAATVGVSSTDVQAAIEELDSEKASTSYVDGAVSAHTSDPTAAHAASAISNTPSGGISSTDVQDALNELDSDKLSTSAVGTAAYEDAGAFVAATGDTMTGALLMSAAVVQATMGAASADAFTARVSGDSNPRVSISPEGIALGSGSGVEDVTIQRSAANTAEVAGNLNVTGNLTDGGTAVSLVGHTHTHTSITDFDAEVNALSDARIAAASIEDLADVASFTPSANDVLTWNGSAWTALPAGTPGSHASTHISGGGDEVDGDRLDIDYPGTGTIGSGYTPATVSPHSTSTSHLASHLYGIAIALNSNYNEIQAAETDIANHLSDTTDAHDASAISVDSTNLAGVGTDVQAVLEELEDRMDGFKLHMGKYETASVTGNVAITDPGFTPDFILFFAGLNTAGSAAAVLGVGAAARTGFYTSASRWAISIAGGHGSTASARRRNNSAAIEVINNSGTVLKAATVNSWDANGFTLNFSTNDSNGWGLYYIAVKMS